MEGAKTPETTSLRTDTKPGLVKIRIGETIYLVDTEKIPYFQAFVRFERSVGSARPSDGDGADEPLIHGDIPFFDVINAAAEKGLRECFRRMPTMDLADYRTLCEQLDFLGFDVLGKRTLQDIHRELRKLSKLCIKMPCVDQRKGLARDSAFRLLYAFLRSEFKRKDHLRDASTAWEATMFMVSSITWCVFKSGIQKLVRAAYGDRFKASARQIWLLDTQMEGTLSLGPEYDFSGDEEE